MYTQKYMTKITRTQTNFDPQEQGEENGFSPPQSKETMHANIDLPPH
jgi:hypothetical protein